MKPYLVDGIWPKNRVHLVAGPSDAGKTRWLIPTMLDVQAGRPIAGGASHPAPWLYVAADRVLEEVHETIATMGFDPSSVPILPAFGVRAKTSILSLMDAIRLMKDKPEVLVIEGFQGFVDGTGVREKEVKEFLSGCAAHCQPSKELPNGLTIIGVCESPKMKPSEKYANPRQRVSGVSAWSYYSSTIILIENVKNDAEYLTSERQMYICTKNGRRRSPKAFFDDAGRLVIDPMSEI